MTGESAGAGERRRLPRQVVALGWTSFFTDLSSEMIVPLLPAFLSGVLGAGALALGWVEGVADAIASVLKLLSGRWSDRLGRTRPFVAGGYVLASVARPLVALATLPWHVVLVRAVDRTGKGLRTSPRDALIASATEAPRRGAAFGFHRAMDHAGAVVGPLAAILLLRFATEDLRTVFWMAAIPAAIACAVVLGFVRDPPAAVHVEARTAAPLGTPSPALRRLLVPLAIFTVGNASDLFLLLQLTERGSEPVQLSLLWLGLHVVKTVSSLYGGRLADRLGAVPTIATAWVVYAACYLGLALAQDPAVIAGLCLLYGTYHGLSEAPERALVSRIAPSAGRGSAFGWYHLTVGILALPASVLFGWVWSAFGSAAAFGMGAALAGIATAALLALRPDSA